MFIDSEHSSFSIETVADLILAAKKWIEEGMKLVLVSTDVGMIMDTGTRLAHEMKDFVRGR